MIEQQPRRLGWLVVGIASFFVIIWGIQNSKFIINPILLALVITITVLPVPGWLSKRGMPGWLSLTLTILVVVGTLASVVLLVIFSITKLSAQIPTYNASSTQQQTAPASTPAPLQATSTGDQPYPTITPTSTPVIPPGTVDTLIDSLSAEINQLVQSQQFNDVFASIVAIIGKSLFMVFMVLMMFAFMLAAAISLPSTARMGLSPDNPMIRRVTTLTGEVRHYMTLMTVINFLVGLGDAIFLYILGIDFALLWGILAFVLGYIPSIGFWIALIPPTILAYMQYGPQTALIVFLGYVLINGSIQNFVQPKIFGQGLKISPVIIFISLFVWGWLLGGIGAILAVPITLMIISLLENFDSTRWLIVLIRATPEKEKGEHEQAVNRFRESWNKLRSNIRPENNP